MNMLRRSLVSMNYPRWDSLGFAIAVPILVNLGVASLVSGIVSVREPGHPAPRTVAIPATEIAPPNPPTRDWRRLEFGAIIQNEVAVSSWRAVPGVRNSDQASIGWAIEYENRSSREVCRVIRFLYLAEDGSVLDRSDPVAACFIPGPGRFREIDWVHPDSLTRIARFVVELELLDGR